MELIKKTIKVGNSAGVILPKSLLGSEVKITVVKRPLNIKKDTLRMLDPFLEDLLGIYLIEQDEKKVEVLAVSFSTQKNILTETYKINIVPIENLKSSLKNKPLIKQRIKKARVILNRSLLNDLRKI
ncbi:MAG: DUF2080 family transposase-associated protein [archaeon]